MNLPNPKTASSYTCCTALFLALSFGGHASPQPAYEEGFRELHALLGRKYPSFPLKGIDWKRIGTEFLPRAKDVQNDHEFGLLCMELVARLEDGHAQLLEGKASLPALEYGWDPGFACLIDDRTKPVVYYVDKGSPAQIMGVSPGMTLLSLDGTPAKLALEKTSKRLSRFTGYSSDRHLRYDACRQLARVMKDGSAIELVFESTDGKKSSLELTAKCGVRYLPRLPVPIEGIRDDGDVSWKMLDDTTGYIYVRKIRDGLVEKLDSAVTALAAAKGIIVDVRGNSGGGFDEKISHLNFDLNRNADQPDRPRFKGPMALLIDARCISAGEGWASWFVAKKRARIFGEATAGASGRKETCELKGGPYKVVFPVKTYNGFLDRPIERRGIEPDVPLFQNAGDLAEGRDTVLEAARTFLLKQSR